ncbi:putative nuclease HARBI1 [Morus notabilis]|uniref:putative nuclease HARBI1 n=1 Tax=Morus notabilis TaxID=981085 RepID=UPI000CED4D61|nr:putative nuclease HARBI1 [Morus notabilis]
MGAAVATYVWLDLERRPRHISSLRGIDKNCVGAIDGTHVPCTPIGVDNPTAYRNRKGVNSQNIMAACSFDMKFTYILSGWEGSAHDARVLADAVGTPRFKFPHPPLGKYYLVDSAYANNDYFLALYRGGTYHLADYRRRTGGFQGPRDIFNYKHSSLRNCIDRTFGVWKARFPILRRPNNSYPMKKQVKIPVACAILHNFIHIVSEGDPLLNQYYRDGVPVSEIDPNNTDEFDDDDYDGNVPEGPVVTGASVSHIEMSRFRDRLANEMWVEYKKSCGKQV